MKVGKAKNGSEEKADAPLSSKGEAPMTFGDDGTKLTVKRYQYDFHKIKTAEINFLCVHKKLRSKRLAPVLIKEVTRRINLRGVWQAVYTAGVVLPKPMAECRYYHRSLNPKKLIDVGFSSLNRHMTMARTIRMYKLPEEPQIEGIRPMEEKDVGGVYSLLKGYLKSFGLHPELTQDEVRHWIMPR